MKSWLLNISKQNIYHNFSHSAPIKHHNCFFPVAIQTACSTAKKAIQTENQPEVNYKMEYFASHLSLQRYMAAAREMTNSVLHCILHGQFQWYFSKHQIEILYCTTGQESTKSISLDALASQVTKRYPSKTCTKGTRCKHPKRDLRVV